MMPAFGDSAHQANQHSNLAVAKYVLEKITDGGDTLQTCERTYAIHQRLM